MPLRIGKTDEPEEWMGNQDPDASDITARIEAYYDAYRTTIHRYLRHGFGVRDDDACEEVVQQAFVRVLQRLREGHPLSDEPLPFLLRTARNLMLNEMRNSRKHEELRPEVTAHLVSSAPESLSAHAHSTEGRVRHREQRAAVKRALSEMTFQERRCTILHAQGLEFAQIARLENLPRRRRAGEAAARGLSTLRKYLENYLGT